MFTNNYIALKKQIFLSSYSTYYKDVRGQSIQGYNCTLAYYDIGQWLHLARCQSIKTTVTSGNPGNYPGVYFGSGSTPATKDDYTLESPITSGLSITNPSALTWVDNGNGKYTATASYVVQNTTDAEINIYEIGVFSSVNTYYLGSSNNSSNQFFLVLMERTVLDVPIVIAPGEAKLVTYKVTFNQTLNVE